MNEYILVCVAWPYANADIHQGNVTGSYLRAASRKLPTRLIDLNAPMLEINAREQKLDPKFSLADLGDRVHPLERGHFVMAYEFLRQTRMPTTAKGHIYIDPVWLNRQQVQRFFCKYW